MPKTRLGSIEFINSLPVDLGLLSGAVPADLAIEQSSPAVLNVKMAAGELDISPVSVFAYAERRDDLVLLSDLSISSESGVRSVVLISREPLDQLAGRPITLTSKGRTTPALLEVICRQRYGFEPEWVFGDADAALLIGDEALEAQHRLKDSGLFLTDLAEEWKAWTGKPFVFAVWAARREFFELNPERVREAHEALLESKRWGAARSEAVLAEAHRRTQLPYPLLEDYFARLSHDFGPELKEGMNHFLDRAARCGLLETAVEALG